MKDTVCSSVKALTAGNIAILRLYFTNLFKPYLHLPKELYDDVALATRMRKQQDFSLLVDRKFVDEFKKDVDGTGEYIKRMWGKSSHVDYQIKQMLFWSIRFASIGAAFHKTDNQLQYLFFITVLQFVVLPYSLSMAFCYGLETVFVLYTGHVLVASILTAFANTIVPDEYNYAIIISPTFLAVFITIDQLLCALTLFWTPVGCVEKMSPSRIWQSVWYGFLNCKTYYLILLPVAYGSKIAIIPWIVDYAFGISNLITKRTMAYWNVMFYLAHRIGHLPVVYADAHRFHHHLHDSTSFDAHIFGSGAPEEWFILAADIFVVRFLRIYPASLSPSVLAVSWFNKWGFHARVQVPEDDGVNFHVNHHSLHVKNLGNAYPYDLLLGTAMKERVKWAGYEVHCENADDGKSRKICFNVLKDDSSLKVAKKKSLTMSGVDFSRLFEAYGHFDTDALQGNVDKADSEHLMTGVDKSS